MASRAKKKIDSEQHFHPTLSHCPTCSEKLTPIAKMCESCWRASFPEGSPIRERRSTGPAQSAESHTRPLSLTYG